MIQEKSKALELWPQSQTLPGVVELVNHLYLNQIPQAVATSTAKELFELKNKKIINICLKNSIQL